MRRQSVAMVLRSCTPFVSRGNHRVRIRTLGASSSTWLLLARGHTQPEALSRHVPDCGRNRDNAGYAWKVPAAGGVSDMDAPRGPLDCADWTIDGIHLCMTRLNLLQAETPCRRSIPSLPSDGATSRCAWRPRACSVPGAVGPDPSGRGFSRLGQCATPRTGPPCPSHAAPRDPRLAADLLGRGERPHRSPAREAAPLAHRLRHGLRCDQRGALHGAEGGAASGDQPCGQCGTPVSCPSTGAVKHAWDMRRAPAVIRIGMALISSLLLDPIPANDQPVTTKYPA